ncbi:MAG: hypothetical protein WCB67_17925 [Solirubrobacteraceae bacterium]
MASRIASILCVVVLGSLLVPVAALADGDPASDVLLGDNVFYPYTPPVPLSIQRTLNAETTAAKAAGLPVKVALIAAPTDLGVIPDLFGKPQSYADFLDQEISFTSKQRLLVVMSTGYGVQGFDGPATTAIRGVAKPAGKTSTALARAAIVAVARLAAASGHPLKGVPGVNRAPAQSGASGGSKAPIVIALVLAVALVAIALIVLRRRPGGGQSQRRRPARKARNSETP